ncbi:MAG: hypothetical protein ACXWC4_03315 [Telluria sp.]
MSGYFDEQAGANVAGFQRGHIQGTQEGLRQGRAYGFEEGRQEGYSEGFSDGRQEGYDNGWNDAIHRANIEMTKQMEFTRRHVADKVALNQELAEQARLIDELNAQLRARDAECEDLKARDDRSRDIVAAFKCANEQLVTEIGQWEASCRVRTADYAEQVRKYNRNLVFMNAARSVLADLTGRPSQQAGVVRTLFMKSYADEVDAAMKAGVISQPLEKDDGFKKSLPKTQQLIVRLLSDQESYELGE